MAGAGRFIAGLLILVAPAFAAEAQIGKAYPFDDASADAELFAFRARLLEALAARDTAALYRALDPEITNSFGGDGGIAEFQAMWRPHEPSSEVWRLLTRALALGGRRMSDSVFVAPYTFSVLPDSLDAFEHSIVVGSNVLVRRLPDATAAAVDALSFDIVRDDTSRTSPSARGWVGIVLRSGRVGYVSERFVHGALAYRVCLRKRSGAWHITCFVAGD